MLPLGHDDVLAQAAGEIHILVYDPSAAEMTFLCLFVYVTIRGHIKHVG